MDNRTPLLEVKDLNIAFGSGKNPIPTVHDANFQIYPGETVAIVGESGSGKSTTARAIIDLLPATGHVTSGSIVFQGEELVGASDKQMSAIRGRKIGLVPQDPMTNLNPVWTIGQQITEALAANHIAKGKAAKARACELLAEAGMPEPEKHFNQYPHEFSGGMCQRALIAIGLHARPALLIADEPTSALDVTVQKQILDHLEGLIENLGTAVLLITHDLGLAAERATRVIVMQHGHIVEQGPSREILTNPQHPYTKKLIAAAPSLAAQRSETRHHKSSDSGLTLLQVKGVTKRFLLPSSRPWKKEYFTAVNNVDLSIKQMHTTAIVGESGSGKSTLAKMMLGLLDPTEGEVTYEGKPIRKMRRDAELNFRKRVQPVFQNPYGTLDPMWSVFNIIEEPLKVHHLGDKKTRARRVSEIMDRVALPQSMLRRYPMELSGGQQQRIAIARALVLEPELIICDEAVSALDVLVQAQILELLNELQRDLGLTYVFITHDLAVVKQIADDVVVMRNGVIVERGETDELFAHPQQEYTQRLLDAIPGAKILG
ncbi:ABC transporter ATP-binding protein [Lawsonella clevelandensis]|uniref:dipeptide ABC transporter ATP-binding protein n=1 Tax=Lawsonella clevelandensis TaxID=1528099 RepID=UPI0026EA51C5|nr:ABC transporter ATP-binding protein [Lawsonella clevelandensis]